MVNQVEFWQQRWLNNQTGFHEGQVNPYLKKHISLLPEPDNSTVFLPLSGKSIDLIWLSNLGYKVIGVECSELAVNAFFTENNLSATVTEQDNFQIWVSGNITIYCGDFYELKSIWFESVNTIFDRAALVALPKEQRTNYFNQLKIICPNVRILLVSLEYHQEEMNGPPFSVAENEIKELYSDFKLSLIESNDILSENEKFKERGLSSLIEKVFLINH
jgi:thiopurine S-methyltransferase